MKKIKIPEKIFNNIVEYFDNLKKNEISWQRILLTYNVNKLIFNKNYYSKYYKYIINEIHDLLLENDKLIVIKNSEYDIFLKFKKDSSFNLKEFLLNYFELINDDTNLITYRCIKKYINSLGINYLLTRKDLLNYLRNSPCIYSENYIDTIRNYLEKSGYICKATTNTGAIVAGKFYIKKLIPENLSLNDLKKEYINSLEKLYPKYKIS